MARSAAAARPPVVTRTGISCTGKCEHTTLLLRQLRITSEENKMSKFNLDGKVCVVTGGGGSIGGQTCRELANGGGKIVVTGRTQETLDAVVAQITAEGQEAIAVVCDITKPDQVNNLMSETVRALG